MLTSSRLQSSRRITAWGLLLGLVACIAALAVALPLSAAQPVAEIVGAADATRPAVRVVDRGGLVSVSQSGAMTRSVIDSAKAAAASVGATATDSSGYGIGMAWVRRGDVVIQQATPGPGVWQYPMSVTVVPVGSLATLMSSEVDAAVANGTVAMGQTTAALRGARAGDTIGLVARGGEIVPFTIGVVAPDAHIGGTEIVMSPRQAALLGADEVTRVLISGAFDRAALLRALATRGLVDGTHVRIRRSWDAPNPDAVLGTVRTKQLFGEFAYQLTDTGVTIDPAWVARHLPAERESYSLIEVRARCHNTIRHDLQAALTEVYHSGLAGAIDLSNTNSFGGCYNPRFNRLSGSLGVLSRHAWGQALDMNTATNAQGRTPQMDCRVVRIFRKHNFAWGGNFLVPDGMHFEWVGEPRHTWQYPSEYCPNVAPAGVETSQRVDADATGRAATQRATMFADDGFGAPVDHDHG